MFNLRALLILNVLLAFCMIGLFVVSFKGNTGSGFNVPEQTVHSINLTGPYDFCGEVFPLDNWDVKQRLDAELLRNAYFHSQTILAVKRANALFPIIEPILKAEGAPDDLKYLAAAESTLSNAISPVGAKGVWQFMKATALEYGMEVNDEVDERYHLEKATHAAARYLMRERASLGSWVFAAAAYNGGHGRIATEKVNQRAATFFDLNLSADETMRYPFRIVAIKEVMAHPETYEYTIEKDHLYPPLDYTRTVEVSGPVANWGDFAVEHGTTYRMLKLYNPWLIGSKLTNKAGKKYVVTLPRS